MSLMTTIGKHALFLLIPIEIVLTWEGEGQEGKRATGQGGKGARGRAIPPLMVMRTKACGTLALGWAVGK